LSRALPELRPLFPGVVIAGLVALAASWLAEHYATPVMLFALLLGIAVNFLSQDERCRPGLDFASRNVLRLGVALLGARITLAQVESLGGAALVLTATAVVLTILCGVALARATRQSTTFGLLTGGSVGICGASAALAIASVLPRSASLERDTVMTVVSVTALSTVAMVLYPVVAAGLGLDERTAGIFLGATIHDVAQVVGAGYSMSHETGDVATFVKLMRVAMLLPVIVLAVMITRARGGEAGGKRPPLLPWFAVAFAVLVAINSTGWLPAALVSSGSDLSRWFLVAAIAAIGMKTQLRDLATVGLKPVLLMLGETVFLALLVLALQRWMP